MKSKGFTLIELLAVIVILAIIALIAVPIILNIIDSSKDSANERSKELYLDSVEQAIARKNLTEKNGYNPTECTVNGTGNLDCKNEEGNLSELTVGVNGAKPDEGSKITFVNGKITSSDLKFSNESQKEESVSQICTLVEGNSKEVGAKYKCTVKEDVYFYVLENNESSDKITLIMDRNYADTQVPATMAWCNQEGENPRNIACNHDGLDPYIDKIQVKFGNKVEVGIPSEEQLEKTGCTLDMGSCPIWLYDYLEHSSNSVSEVGGYWTNTPAYEYAVYHVTFDGDEGYFLLDGDVGDNERNGIRPVITVSKFDIS